MTGWPTGTRIDVAAEAPGKLELYELKADRAEPRNLYQLKMYWDGLVLQGCQPTHGTLLVQNYSSDLKLMLDQMNRLPPPLTRDGRPSAPLRAGHRHPRRKASELRRKP